MKQAITAEHITAMLLLPLESGEVGETDYLILDEDDGTLSVGQMGVSDGLNRRGFEIAHFIDFDEDGNRVIYDKMVGLLSEILEFDF